MKYIEQNDAFHFLMNIQKFKPELTTMDSFNRFSLGIQIYKWYKILLHANFKYIKDKFSFHPNII